MKNIIYLSNTSAQLVSGVCNGSNQIDISDFQDYQLPEGTMLDGAIMDEDALKDVLRIINKKGIGDCKLVIDSGQIVHKNLIVPKIKDKEIHAIVKEEIDSLENGEHDLIYDYTILKDKLVDKPGIEILCCAMKKQMIEDYLNIFDDVGIELTIDISLNAIDKLIEDIIRLSQRNFVIAVINGNDIALYLFEEGKYVFSNRSRLFSERGSSSFTMEVSNILIKFKQFIKTADYNQNIERVYFCGLDDYEEKMLFEVVSDSVDIRAMRLANSNTIYYSGNSKEFLLHKYVYAIGSLCER